MRRTVGPGRPIGIRDDSTWNVPEPEIGVVLGENGRIAGYTIGNDVSSRDIEGANPLYLPQAKIYAGACSFGPAVFVPDEAEPHFHLTLRVTDEWGRIVFEGESFTSTMRRILRRARRMAAARQPRPAREHPADRDRARSAGQLHAAPGPLRRDPRPRDRHARQSRRACLRADRKGARPMTETLTGAPARNYIGGEWRESSAGETYEKRNPWRPSVVPVSSRPRPQMTRKPRSRLRMRLSRRGRPCPPDSALCTSRKPPPRSRPEPSRSRRT